jgi:predicted Fe-S protein YdhL (DUF1289 family)
MLCLISLDVEERVTKQIEIDYWDGIIEQRSWYTKQHQHWDEQKNYAKQQLKRWEKMVSLSNLKNDCMSQEDPILAKIDLAEAAELLRDQNNKAQHNLDAENKYLESQVHLFEKSQEELNATKTSKHEAVQQEVLWNRMMSAAYLNYAAAHVTESPYDPFAARAALNAAAASLNTVVAAFQDVDPTAERSALSALATPLAESQHVERSALSALATPLAESQHVDPTAERSALSAASMSLKRTAAVLQHAKGVAEHLSVDAPFLAEIQHVDPTADPSALFKVTKFLEDAAASLTDSQNTDHTSTLSMAAGVLTAMALSLATPLAESQRVDPTTASFLSMVAEFLAATAATLTEGQSTDPSALFKVIKCLEDVVASLTDSPNTDHTSTLSMAAGVLTAMAAFLFASVTWRDAKIQWKTEDESIQINDIQDMIHYWSGEVNEGNRCVKKAEANVLSAEKRLCNCLSRKTYAQTICMGSHRYEDQISVWGKYELEAKEKYNEWKSLKRRSRTAYKIALNEKKSARQSHAFMHALGYSEEEWKKENDQKAISALAKASASESINRAGKAFEEYRDIVQFMAVRSHSMPKQVNPIAMMCHSNMLTCYAYTL